VARFNDVHAFDYNSGGSERISMKFGELRVYCLELALTDFGLDPGRSESVQVYCACTTVQLSEKCDFRVSPFCQVVQKHKLFEVA